MRQVATLATPVGGICRVMLYATDEGTCLFMYRTRADGPCQHDGFYEDATAARRAARDQFGVADGDWTPIPDPLPGCQHDWIRPTRVKRDVDGNPLWGQFEAA